MGIKKCVYLIIGIIALLSLQAAGQSNGPTVENKIGNDDEKIIKWIANLYEHGVRVEADTLILSAHVRKLLANDELREILYPRVYTWDYAVAFMKEMKLKKAFWFLINLYPNDKELVMRTVIGYDELFEMDRALIATFYTYGMMDPEVCQINNGELEITRPDLVEKKLGNVKEMVGHVLTYRATKGQQ